MKFFAEKDLSICGLACVLCSREECLGCKAQGCDKDCSIYQCAIRKGLDGCYQCDEFPCGENMLKGTRIRAFNRYARDFGKDALLDRLRQNNENGIFYHRPDTLQGDYDKCKTEDEIIDLIKNGKSNPYDRCPEYESKSFYLRLVSIDDAEDLLECYKNPTISVQANSENCTFGYGAQTLEEMKDFIRRWLDAYNIRSFIRFSIIDKQKNKIAGTIEIFGSDPDDFSLLRLDLLSQYDNEDYLSELFAIADSFFFDVGCGKIASKALPDAPERISALTKNGYSRSSLDGDWEDFYYIKENLRASL